MMERVRMGLVVAGSVLILLACGIKGPARPPLPPQAPAPQAQPPQDAPRGPLAPSTDPSSSVRPAEVPQAAPASGTTRELPPDGGS